MEWLLVLLLIAAAAVVGWLVWKRRQQRDALAKRLSPLGKDPFAEADQDLYQRLRPGDVLGYHGRDWLVRGSLHLDEDGYTWSEHLISDGTEQRWLSVEDDEGLELVLWERVPPGDVSGEAGSDSVVARDLAYRLDEQGQARFTAEGATGTAPSGTAAYADYQASSGEQLSFERFGTQWEVSIGHTVLPRAVTVFPRERP